MRTTNSGELKAGPEALARKVLAERCKANPAYSLRAFAKQSGISVTVLSLVLSGKRKFSRRATERLADHLSLDPKASLSLLRSRRNRVPALAPRTEINLDLFELISDWFHYGILSALELPRAKFEAKWLARHLGISEMQAKLAMDRLVRLGLVGEVKGRMRQVGKPLALDNRTSTVATRRFQHQLLDLAKNALEQEPMPRRDFSSTTFVMNSDQVEYAKQRIRQFRRELSAELERGASPNAVYHLTVQLFPVTPNFPQEQEP